VRTPQIARIHFLLFVRNPDLNGLAGLNVSISKGNYWSQQKLSAQKFRVLNALALRKLMIAHAVSDLVF